MLKSSSFLTLAKNVRSWSHLVLIYGHNHSIHVNISSLVIIELMHSDTGQPREFEVCDMQSFTCNSPWSVCLSESETCSCYVCVWSLMSTRKKFMNVFHCNTFDNRHDKKYNHLAWRDKDVILLFVCFSTLAEKGRLFYDCPQDYVRHQFHFYKHLH